MKYSTRFRLSQVWLVVTVAAYLILTVLTEISDWWLFALYLAGVAPLLFLWLWGERTPANDVVNGVPPQVTNPVSPQQPQYVTVPILRSDPKKAAKNLLDGSEIKILHEPAVSLIDKMGSDRSVTRAARVSVKGLNEEEQAEAKEVGLINYLMKARHGSPFEHATMTFYVKAPIFVFREFMRHRMASYNEMSGRYTVLPPEFYLPSPERPLINAGTSARPEMVPGTQEQYDRYMDRMMRLIEHSWMVYEANLADGIANEMSRAAHLVTLCSQMYVTMNLRSLMNFLSLRVDSPDAAVRTRPQYEIEQVAVEIEKEFARVYPKVYDSFVKNGRVAP